MCLTEFNEQKYTEMVRSEGLEEGLAKGLAKGEAKERIRMIKSFAEKHSIPVEEACEELGLDYSDYEEAQKLLSENA